MTEALVVRASNGAQHPQLAAGKQAVRNRDPQHWCEALNVETVTQTQRAKLVVRNLAGEKPLSLIAILCDAFVDKLLIVGVVLVHGGYRRGVAIIRLSLDPFWLSPVQIGRAPGREGVLQDV